MHFNISTPLNFRIFLQSLQYITNLDFYKLTHQYYIDIQIPHQISLIEKLFCTAKCKELNQKASTRPLLRGAVIAGISLVFCTNIYGVVWFQCLFSQTIYSYFLTAVYVYLTLIMGFSYYTTCFCNPGFVEDRVKMTRTCSSCLFCKPIRSHHCSQCNKCILKMDHHCPWVQNCIGAYNYAQFWQLLLISNINLTYSLALIILALVHSLMYEESILFSSLIKYQIFKYVSLGGSALISGAFDFVIAKLFFFHVGLINSNQTTIEYYENEVNRSLDPHFVSPFCLTSKENFKQIFPNPKLMFIPFVRLKSEIPFDGYFTYDPMTKRDFLEKEGDKKDDDEVSPIDLSALTMQSGSQTNRPSLDEIQSLRMSQLRMAGREDVEIIPRSQVRSPDDMISLAKQDLEKTQKEEKIQQELIVANSKKEGENDDFAIRVEDRGNCDDQNIQTNDQINLNETQREQKAEKKMENDVENVENVADSGKIDKKRKKKVKKTRIEDVTEVQQGQMLFDKAQ